MAKGAKPTQPPDPATSYERAKPEKEAGMGRLDAPKAVPADAPDRMDQAAHAQTSRQINADDEVDDTASAKPAGEPVESAPEKPEQPDHSMHNEEPLGEDQAPADIHDPKAKRHPRKEGKGGVP